MNWPLDSSCAERWKKSRHCRRVTLVRRSKRRCSLALLLASQADVHPDQDRKHGESEQGRPLEEKAEQDQDEAHILGVPHIGIGTCDRQLTLSLSLIQYLPCGRYQKKPSADEHEAEEMKRPKVRIRLPAEEHFQEMPRVVREPVNTRVLALEPPGQEIDRERKPVHLREHGFAAVPSPR